MVDRIKNFKINFFNYSFSIDSITGNPLFSGSFFLIIGTNLANFIAYIYHLIFGRILGPSQYGELAATISLVGLVMSAFSFFGTVIIKFVSSAEKKDLPAILGWFNDKVFKIAIPVAIIVWFVSPFLGEYTHLPKNITFLFAPLLFLSIVTLVYRSFLQGLMKFKEVAILANVELGGRLLFGFLFIYLSMGVFGGVLGILASMIMGFVLIKYFLKNTVFSKGKIENFNLKKVVSYALPVFVVAFSFTSLLTIDLIMVKHFFSSYEAGIYGSVSNLGKIIYYGTAPIAAVMFPIISKKKSAGERFVKIFLLSGVLTCLLAFAALSIYYLFPNFTISILYGKGYLDGSKYLVMMGLYYTFYSLAHLMSSFLLSIDMTKPLYALPIFAVVQAVAINFLHFSFGWVIGSSMLSISLLLAYLAIYFVYAKRRT